jgi:hypothetical protein
MPRLELKSSQTFICIKRCEWTKSQKVIKRSQISLKKVAHMCATTVDHGPRGISTTGAYAPLTKLVGKFTIISRCRYDISFLSLYLPHSYARAPLRPKQASSFHQELSADNRFAGGSQKVIFGASSCKGRDVENGGNTFF